MTNPLWPVAALFLAGAGAVATQAPLAPAIAAGGLCAYAAWSYLGFARATRALEGDIAWLQAEVQALPAGHEPAAEAPQALADAWHGYRQALLHDPQGGRLRAAQPAASHFSQATIVERAVNLPLHHALPGLLLGMGICFTFLGLALALQAAGAGAATPDAEVARRALQGLYAAAAFKFVTSIAALVCSVMYAAAEKRDLHRLLGALDGLCVALDRRFEPLALEALVLRLAGQAPGQAVQAPAPILDHEALALRLETGLANAVGLAVGQAVAGSLEAALARDVVPALRGLGEQLKADRRAEGPTGEALADILAVRLDAAGDRAVQQHHEGLQVLFSAQHDALAAALSGQREGLIAVVADLERVLRRDAELRAAGNQEHARAIGSVREATAELVRYAQAVGLHNGERIEQLQELARLVGDQVQAVDKSYAGLVTTLDQAMATGNTQLARYLETAAERQGHFFDSYDAAVTRLYEKLLQAANYLVEAEQQRRAAQA